ncbi:MAG: DUF4931 domain-containing protein [Candidatus Saccharimonadales bacterium]
MVDKNTHNRSQSDEPSQVRKHYYLNQYVVIAPRRNKRPRPKSEEVLSQKTELQPQIESNPSLYEVPNEEGGWRIKVVANDYPALSPGSTRAKGAQEVVLETPAINTPFHQLSIEQIQAVLETYQHRTHLLRQRYGYVSIFKNHGPQAGATLAHTHSQIIASEFIPPEVRREREVLTEYQLKHDTSALCDVIRWELEQDQRAVAHTRFTTTITPYASQYPLEIWIIPNRQSHSIVNLSTEELRSLADHLKGVATALGGNGVDYNYHLQEGIADEYNHFFIKVIPRLSILGGYELNTGTHINTISPEYACKWYQKHIKTPDVG